MDLLELTEYPKKNSEKTKISYRENLFNEITEKGVTTDEGLLPNIVTGEPYIPTEKDYVKAPDITEVELEFIKKNWLVFTDIELAKILDITPSYVRDLRKRLGLKRDSKSRTISKFSPPFIVIMPSLYYDEFDETITELGIEELVHGPDKRAKNPIRFIRNRD